MLSVTRVYIWWKKRGNRINRRVPAVVDPARASRSGRSVVSVVGDGGCEAVHNNRAGATVSLDIPDIAEAETGRAKGMHISSRAAQILSV
jgi:hypothetical protein